MILIGLFMILLSFNKKILTHIFNNSDLKKEFLTETYENYETEFDEISIDTILENMKENDTKSSYLTLQNLPSN